MSAAVSAPRRLRACMLIALAAYVPMLPGCMRAGSVDTTTVPPSALVVLGVAQRRDIIESIPAAGEVQPGVDAVRDVTVPYESVVLRVGVAPGRAVQPRHALLQVAAIAPAHPGPLQARRDAALAAAEHARLSRLRSDGLATANELQAAATADAAAQEQLRAAEAPEVAVRGAISVRSPMAGIVEQVFVRPGSVATAGSVLVRVTKASVLEVRLGIEPADAGRVVEGASVTLSTLGAVPRTARATVTTVERRVDPETRLATVVVPVPPALGTLAGETLRARLVTAVHPNALSVPRSAVLYDGDRPYVFVAIGSAKVRSARRVAVVIGATDDSFVELRDGVAAGQAVIVLGNAALEDGMVIRTAESPRP